jgi:hypothetical protein
LCAVAAQCIEYGGIVVNWYHGTPIEFESFDPMFIGQGNDQLGSGFYFTNTFETARNYALRDVGDGEERVVLIVAIDIDRPLPLEGGLTASQVELIMRASPEFDDVLMNFGDVDYEGEEKVLALAVGTYLRSIDGDTLMGLNSLSNDFFRGNEAKFLRTVHDVAGYDGLIRRVGDELHAVAWLPERIKIIERIKVVELFTGLKAASIVP